MNKFFETDPLMLKENVFRQIGREWMLITAGREGGLNTMTASWGGLGVLWNVNVAFIYVRPSRYTMEFIERERFFSLSFLGDGNRRPLQYCGAHSGRDGDKIAAAGLTPRFDATAPYFDESRLAFICKKMYSQDLDPAAFLDPAIDGSYAEGDYHRLYVGEITKVLTQDERR